VKGRPIDTAANIKIVTMAEILILGFADHRFAARGDRPWTGIR
jgi:hypothetical protein